MHFGRDLCRRRHGAHELLGVAQGLVAVFLPGPPSGESRKSLGVRSARALDSRRADLRLRVEPWQRCRVLGVVAPTVSNHRFDQQLAQPWSNLAGLGTYVVDFGLRSAHALRPHDGLRRTKGLMRCGQPIRCARADDALLPQASEDGGASRPSPARAAPERATHITQILPSWAGAHRLGQASLLSSIVPTHSARRTAPVQEVRAGRSRSRRATLDAELAPPAKR